MARNHRRCRRSPAPSFAEGQRPFRVGSLVEVRSNEIGLRGAWFEATVAQILPRHRSYVVSYSFPNPLKERVFFSLLRPRPPAADSASVFGLHQCVEAFHYGGWWKGVVSKLLGEDCSYAVCFPTTREELQFKAAEVRRRLEWVEGNWVPVEDDQEGHVMFGEGTRVEVSCDRENYGVAWFIGTVLKVIGKINFLVEYEYPRVGDNGTEVLLKEIVDLQYIRPCPPALAFTSFNVLDEVEGFHQNGWFAGVVSAILPGPRYIVKHKHKEEEMVLDLTSLRPRCVWDNGHWVHISRDQRCKAGTPRRTKLAIHRQKSSASERSSHPISLLMPSDDDGDVADRPSISALKRKKADGTSQVALVESSRASKRSKKGKSVEESLQLGNGMIQDKSGGLSIPVTAFRNNDVEIADGSDPVNLKGKEAMGPGLECGVELSQPGKKLKKEKSLGEHLQLVDETKPVSRRQRSHSSKRSIIPSLVLTSSNTDDEVADMFSAVNLKDRKAAEPNLEYESSHPSKKLDKVKSLEEHLKSVDGTLRDCGYKTPEAVGKHSTAAKKLTLERSPALVAGQHHLRSLCESIAPDCKMGLHSQSTPLSKDLCQEQDTSDANGANESIVSGKESSCLFGEGCEHKSKEASFVNSPVGNHAANFVPTADWGNGKGDTSPAENTKMLRKKVVARTPKRRGMTLEVVHEQGEMEEHKGGIPSQNIFFMNRMKPKRLENGTELVVGGEDGRGFELFNQMPTLDVSDNSQPVDRHNKVLDSKNSPLTITSEEKPPGNGGISFSNKQADIMEDAHVTPLIESSVLNAELLKCSVVQKSPILKSFPSRGDEIWSYANKHAEAGAGTRLQAIPSMEDGGHDQDVSTFTGSPADKGVEIEGAPINSCTGSSHHPEDNVFEENEFSPSRLLSEKAFVETEDVSPIDPSPKGLLISREDEVADHDELTLCGSLSERPVVGMEQAPCHPNPCGSLPSNKDTHDHDKLIPNAVPLVTSDSFVSGICEIQSCDNGINENGRERENQALPARFKENISSEIDERAKRIGEIRSCVNGLDENGREKENLALPAHFEENIASECDEFALTTSGTNIFKGGEKALMGPLPMKLPEKSVLPFTKTSELWESVESREVFRMLPQQPHFRPLLQYGKRFREGMALGLMVTFAKLMTDISSLCIVDSQLEFEEKLKALGPLESNGFDIQPARARLEKLLGLRGALNQSEDKKHSLRTEVQELEEEREQNSLLMFSVENVISELKQKLTDLQEKRESMLLDIRKNATKLGNLKTSFQEAEEASTSIERQFSCALNAPW